MHAGTTTGGHHRGSNQPSSPHASGGDPVALIQAVVPVLMAGVVLTRAGVALRNWYRASRWLVWWVVAFSVVALVLDLIISRKSARG
jgi:hypothetical protein